MIAFLDGALAIFGFSITSLIIKLFLLINFLILKIPHLETSFLLTFLDAMTETLYFLWSLIISSEQFFLIIKSSGNSIRKWDDLIKFLHFKTASPVPNGLFW